MILILKTRALASHALFVRVLSPYTFLADHAIFPSVLFSCMIIRVQGYRCLQLWNVWYCFVTGV